MQTKPYKVNPDSELGRLLNRAEGTPLLVEMDGMRFRIVREAEDPFADYDPEKARAALRASAGALKGVNTKRLKESLRAMREQDSIGRPA